MRKTLCLVFLGCALVVGLACSGDSSTPTAPATSGLKSTTAESADKIFICHGDRSGDPGTVVEVSNEYYKRHLKHLNSTRDCRCVYDSVAGEECNVTNGSGVYCANSYDCPGGA